MRGCADLMPKKKTPGLLAREKNKVFRTAVGVTRCTETVAETPGKSGKNFGQKITGAFPPNSTEHRSPVKEKKSQKKTVEKAK